MTRESITICLRVISIKFLLSISKLNKTMWSWKLTAWSQKMNLIDTSTNFLHYSYYKRIRTTNKNLNFVTRCLRVKNVFSLILKMDQLPRNQRKESWRKRKEELEVSQRQAVSDIIFNWLLFFPPFYWKRQQEMITTSVSNKFYYYSFKIFPRFRLAKSTRLIHHNQFLMTIFGRILCLARKWRQKCSVLVG